MMFTKKTLLALCLCMPSLVFAQNTTPLQKVSYALGYSLGEHIPPEADINAIIAGLRDVRSQQPAKYSDAEMQVAYATYQKEIEQQNQQAHASTKAEGTAFLTQNAKKAGVKTTASGLQYQIITQGTGKKPKASSKVSVHYEGRLIDGTVFDSSYKRGQPIAFPLNGVIKGWTEGLQLLQEGGKMRLFIPAHLAYGDREMPSIPAHSTLIFDVELLKVH